LKKALQEAAEVEVLAAVAAERPSVVVEEANFAVVEILEEAAIFAVVGEIFEAEVETFEAEAEPSGAVHR
jgi:hypothetical protein